MKAAGRQQGTVLIEMGCISPHNLRYALELQLRLKLLEVFSWTKGEFQFNPRAQPPAETVRLQMSTAAIVYEGVRRSYDQARLRGALCNGAIDASSSSGVTARRYATRSPFGFRTSQV